MVTKSSSVFKDIRMHYTRTAAFSTALLVCSSANYAFDNNAFNQTQAMDQFLKRFGDCNAKGKCKFSSTYLALFNSINYVFFSLGILIGTWFQGRYGRKKTVASMMIIPVVACILLLTAKEKWQLFVGRQAFYVFAGMDLGCVPIYQAELAPKEIRGFAVGMYQLSYGFGALIMTSICRGTSDIQSNASWRIPFGLFLLTPAIVSSGIYWVPESPRWLIAKGRHDEARAVLKRVRRNWTEESLDEEMLQVQMVIEAQDSNSSSWGEMIRGTNLRRTMIVVGIIFFNQATGQDFSTKYGAIFIKQIGSVSPFNFGIIRSAAAIVSTMTAMLCADKLGRRTIFLTGAVLQAGCLLTMGALGTVVPSSPAQKLAIGKGISAMVPLFQLGYGFGSSSVNHVTTAEVPHQALRDKSSRVSGWVNNFTAFVVSFSLPYMLNNPGNLHAKVGFIFGSMAILSFFWGLFFFPECKGKSLEEINLLFYHRVSALKSAKWVPPVDAMTDLQDMGIYGKHGQARTEQQVREDVAKGGIEEHDERVEEKV